MKWLFMSALFFLLCPQSGKAQQLVWANSLAGQGISNPFNLNEGASLCKGITSDLYGNVYVTGYSNDSVDFDPGQGTHWLINGPGDIYFAKYDPTGQLVWARILPSATGRNEGTDVAVDDDGNVYLSGHCQGDVDFDPGPGTAIRSVGPGNANFFFLASYDSLGDFRWASALPSRFAAHCYDLDMDEDHNLYVTGTFYDTLDLSPGPAVHNIVSDFAGVFFAKYDDDGNLIWGKSLSGVGNLGGGSSISCGGSGKVAVAGFFGNTVDFDPGPGVNSLSAGTTADRFFAMYDANGSFQWARSINVNNNGVFTVGRSVQVAVDHAGNAFLAGDFTGTVDVDPGSDSTLLYNPGGYASYLCKLDENGEFVWAKEIDGPYVVVSALQLDCYNRVHLAGSFHSADFDPGPGEAILFSDAPSAFMNFLVQYDADGNYQWAIKVGNNGYGGSNIHPALHVRGQEQYLGGGFKQTGDFDPGVGETLLTASGIGVNSFFSKYESEGIRLVDLGPDTLLCPEEVLLLDATLPGANYLWQDGSAGAIYAASEAGTYHVKVDLMGCTDRDTVVIDWKRCPPSLEMPNVFSPNGDGVNDVFGPMAADQVKTALLQVFDRWGKLLFETRDLNAGWNGKFQGKDCVVGVYYWALRYEGHLVNGDVLVGTVSLWR